MKKFTPYNCLKCILIIGIIGCNKGTEKQNQIASSGFSKDTAQISKLYTEARLYISKADYDSATSLIETYTELSKKNNFKSGIAKAYHQKATIQLQTSKYREAIENINNSIRIRKEINEKKYIAALYNNLSIAYSRLSGSDTAYLYADSCISYAKSVSDSTSLAKGYNTKGNTYGKDGNYAKAAEMYALSLPISTAIGDTDQSMITLGNLAIVHQELDNHKTAIEYNKQALAYKIATQKKATLPITLLNLGVSYEALAMRDSALYYFNEGLSVAKTIKDKSNIGYLYQNLSRTNLSLNAVDDAIAYADSAYLVFKETDDETGQTLSLRNKAECYYKNALKNKVTSDARNAVNYYTESLNLSLKNKETKQILIGQMGLAKSYELLGAFDKAFSYLNDYSSLKDTTRTEEYTQQIADAQTKYETQKKETEIIKLNSEKLLDAEKIARQKTLNFSLLAIAALILISGFLIFRNVQKKRTAEKQIAILEKQNAIESMRGKIASDVHDDMGANLTKLGLNAQQLLINANVPEAEKQMLEKISAQSKDVITGMREIIWASNPANDNLKSMLGFMRQYIDRFFDGTNIRPVVNFPHDVGEVTLHPEVRRNLFLILKESLHNAVKYSGSDKIDIDFSNENENFNLNIKDYGKGMDDKTKDDFSNGLRNMQMRAEQIQSLFKLITAPGKGVQIAIEGKLY